MFYCTYGLALAYKGNDYATEQLIYCKRNPKARPGSTLDVPSESVTFADKRRRLLSTPLITGYYVTDRPPDGQSHNSKAC